MYPQNNLPQGPHAMLRTQLKESRIAVMVCAEYLQGIGKLETREAINISESVDTIIQKILDYLEGLSDQEFMILLGDIEEHIEKMENSLEGRVD